ncbi:MAG: amidohydrolase family protein [Candidatus Bathyarchaeia archaeon]
MTFDILIKNGRIVDGTGNPWFRADVAIKDGRITKIGRQNSPPADRVLDAKALVVSPGFIDMHTHSDYPLLLNPKAESSVRQGVTTEVLGNCGYSCAPVSEATKELLEGNLLAYIPEVAIDWHTIGEYLDRLEERGIAHNAATLVGHGTLRIAVMGLNSRLPNKEELEEMKALVAESMEGGAFGMSTGLVYAPGNSSNTEELVELCRVVAGYGGIYATHVRSERVEAVEEAIGIGEKAEVPVHLSHHPTGTFILRGKTEKTLKLVDEARARGAEVTCDLHPYLWGLTALTAALPGWAFEGGPEKMLERLRDPGIREELKKGMAAGTSTVHQLIRRGLWDRILLGSSEGSPSLVGKSFEEIASLRGTDPYDAVLDVLLAEGLGLQNAFILAETYSEKDVRNVMVHPTSMIGADGFALAPYGPLARFGFHPRSYGTFPRVIQEYVNEKGALTLEDGVRRMTSAPAQRLGLWDRGLVREGMWADIVVFDAERIEDRATYTEPSRYPAGIEHVLVNGEIVIMKGEHTGALPGRALRHTFSSQT